MSSLIVGKFPNQFAASSAFDKLMSRGLHRKQGVVHCDESVGRSAASASAPTSVVSRHSHRGTRQGESRRMRAPEVLPPPAEIGYATLTVEIEDDASINEILAVMQSLHASDVLVVPDKTLGGEDVQFWPEQSVGDATDVERAIDAASRGRGHLS